ncbi:Hpt domain-containing protein [Schlesneria paludicola]|uniref:Hpt domain-containing protein n=1 Tax=Schlesneria paludicola TaxID=360056 RepID=UPI00029AB57A|nr:Hpt domain-containing protein [Schlesneria paludicola]
MPLQVIDNNVWNVGVALAGVDGEVADLRDLAEIWLRQAPRLVADIKEGLKRRDLQGVHISAHTLKGSLQILCAEELGAAARELELAAFGGNVPDEDELLIRLESQLAALSCQVSRFLSDSTVSR